MSITIQARGLLAEEYAYTHRKDRSYLMRCMRAWKVKQFYSLERYVYGIAPHEYANLVIQVVSPALQDYLIATYTTPAKRITIAQHDIPMSIVPAQRVAWRAYIRLQLGIDPAAYVYCYNGSAKPWQLPEEVIHFFEKIYLMDSKKVLLILTQDRECFERLFSNYQLPACAYRICTVPHARMYEYLSACDAGLLFRKTSIINWVSRPTKLLEYQAVGLTVIHNNTVAYAMDT